MQSFDSSGRPAAMAVSLRRPVCRLPQLLLFTEEASMRETLPPASVRVMRGGRGLGHYVGGKQRLRWNVRRVGACKNNSSISKFLLWTPATKEFKMCRLLPFVAAQRLQLARLTPARWPRRRREFTPSLRLTHRFVVRATTGRRVTARFLRPGPHPRPRPLLLMPPA
jgi:hypothetical protein